MVLREREKKYGSGRTISKTDTKIPVNFDIHSLDLMCQFTLSQNRNIRKGSYINLRNLISVLDPTTYKTDIEKNKRITFITKALEARNQGITNPTMIIKYVNGGLVDSNIIDANEFVDLNNNEVDWINSTVSNTLSLLFLYERAQEGINLFTKFLTADADNITKIGLEIESYIAELNTRFRRTKVDSVTSETFSLREETLRDKISNIHSKLVSEYRQLHTGMQGLDLMLGGGFENSRCYLFVGSSGVGKSMTLLDIACQIKKYNPSFKPKDPTKIPAVVYLTQENTVTETVDRLFKMSTGLDMKHYSVDEVLHRLKTDGELYLTDDSPIDIIIKYQPNRSVDTSYLYTMTEDLEDEGYEVICLIQDHVKRIKSIDNQPDTRLELGNVVNEMKTFAIIKDIPVITVSHLNREGARVLESATGRTKGDLTRMLGKANVGESLLMIDNVDFAGILNSDHDQEGIKYIIVKCIKSRFKSLLDYFCQPYINGNDIKLVEDQGQMPAYKDSLYDSGSMNITGNIKNSPYQSIPEDDEDDNLFSSRYNSSNSNSIRTISNTKTYVPSSMSIQVPEVDLENNIIYAFSFDIDEESA